jgi:esterase/lipase
MRMKIKKIENKYIKGSKKMLKIVEMIHRKTEKDPSNAGKIWEKYLPQKKIDKLLFKFVEETKKYDIKKFKAELKRIKEKYKKYNFQFYNFGCTTKIFKIYKNKKIVSLVILGNRNPLIDIYYKQDIPKELIKSLRKVYEKNGFVCITLTERKELRKNKTYNELFHGGGRAVLNSKRDPFYQMGIYEEDEVIFLDKNPEFKKFAEKQRRLLQEEIKRLK